MKTGGGGVPWAHRAAPQPGGCRRCNGREAGSQDHVCEEDRGEGVRAGEPGTHVSWVPGAQGQGFSPHVAQLALLCFMLTGGTIVL